MALDTFMTDEELEQEFLQYNVKQPDVARLISNIKELRSKLTETFVKLENTEWKLQRAEKALKSAGYEDCGAELKLPPDINPFKQRLHNELLIKLAKRFSNYQGDSLYTNSDLRLLIDQICE